MKTIVDKKLINEDLGLSIVKAFRITNKRAGEAKRAGAERHAEYLQYCAHLRDLSEKAEEAGFHIWVNSDGKTGHTYDKDYRQTADETNDYDRHLEEVKNALAAEQMNNIMTAVLPAVDGTIPRMPN